MVNGLSADIPTSVVDIPSVCSNINLLRSELLDFLVHEASPDVLKILLVVVSRLGVTHDANRCVPFALLGSQEVLIDFILDIFDNVMNSISDMVTWVSLEVFLVASVVELAVSNRA